MIIIGLTGSIAMGKTETARLFASLGVPFFDSDREVNKLYRPGGAAVAQIARLAPGVVVDHAVDRTCLTKAILAKPQLLKQIEAIVHPLVRRSQLAFLEESRQQHYKIAVLDIPLLFETGQNDIVDKIVVVSAPPELQRQRALGRPGMTPENLDFILSRQLPDSEKRRMADYVIDTSGGLEDAKRQVLAILTDLKNAEGNTKT